MLVVAWPGGRRGRCARSGRGGRRCRAVADRSASPAWPSRPLAALALSHDRGRRADAAAADSGADLLGACRRKEIRIRRSAFAARCNAATAQDQAPPAGIFTAPSRIGATPVYGSPAGLRRRRHRLRFHQYGPAQEAGADADLRPRRRQAQPETTFEPVPDIRAAAAARTRRPPPPPRRAGGPSAESRKPARRRTAAAARPLAGEQSAAAGLSACGGEPARRHRADPAGRRFRRLPAVGETPPPGTPPLNTLPLGTAAAAAADRRRATPTRRSACAPARFCSIPPSNCRPATIPIRNSAPGGPSSSLFVVAPELQVQSDWSRHSLTADIKGTYNEYGADLSPSLNRPYLNSTIDGRIDVLRDTQILLENRFLLSTENPGSPNLQAGLAKLPIYTDVGGTLGLAQTFNRLQVTVKGTGRPHQLRQLRSHRRRSRQQRRSQLQPVWRHAARRLRTRSRPQAFRRSAAATSASTIKSSTAAACSAIPPAAASRSAATVNLVGSLTGEIAAGYLERIYKDPTSAEYRRPDRSTAR